MTNRFSQKVPVGISACLLGQNVRYNGGHSQSTYCLRTLSPYFEFQPFCPEMATGLGTPRETLRLVGDPEQPELVARSTPSTDIGPSLLAASQSFLERSSQLDGYILMKNSPSCGLHRIKVYQENGHPHPQRSTGIFANALKKAYPLLPIEEEGRLNDDMLRENFLMRVFAHHEFRHKVLATPSLHALMTFHRHYKYVLMAHSQSSYRHLGRLLATAQDTPLEKLQEQYFCDFMTAIQIPASRGNHANVMLHLLGYLKKTLPGEARQKISRVIDQYREGDLNLATPITLLRHYLQLYQCSYAVDQRYLDPYPDSLGLRNGI